MNEKPDILELNYRAPREDYPRGDQFVAYMISVAMGAGGVFLLGALIEIFFSSIKSGPQVVAGLLVCAIVGLIGAVIASNIFRFFSGTDRASPRLIVILGTLNGLIGMGAFLTCYVLFHHHLLSHGEYFSGAVFALNAALPVLMSVIKRIKQRPPGT